MPPCRPCLAMTAGPTAAGCSAMRGDSHVLRQDRIRTGHPRRPCRGAQAGAQRPRRAVLLDRLDRRSRPSPRDTGERPVHARCRHSAPQGRAPSRRRRGPGRPASPNCRAGNHPPVPPGRPNRGSRPPSRRYFRVPACAPRRGGAEPRPGGCGRAGEAACRAISLIDGDFHEPHRFPSRSDHPGDPALTPRARARERAQDPTRRLRPDPAPGLHQGPRAAGEPRRPRRRRGR